MRSASNPLMLDCQGLSCPEPVIQCRMLIQDKFPQFFTVLVDNLAAQENVMRMLDKQGYTGTAIVRGPTIYIEARQRPDAKNPNAHKPESMQAPAYNAVPTPDTAKNPDQQATVANPLVQMAAEQKKIIVFITSDKLGQGDDALGSSLMENFLSTLPEMGSDLWQIILLNGGVRLACKRSKSLEALKTLANNGVPVLVCGTCLNFFNLMNYKAVGETTNMLDIVSALAVASSVIKI